MQILNAKSKYEDIHGKVKVSNTSLADTYPKERNKTVDLLINYNGDELKEFIANEKLLKQLSCLSKDKDYRDHVMNETMAQNALYE